MDVVGNHRNGIGVSLRSVTVLTVVSKCELLLLMEFESSGSCFMKISGPGFSIQSNVWSLDFVLIYLKSCVLLCSTCDHHFLTKV